MKKKQQVRISNQEEFNKHLQHTSPTTWIVLGAVIALLIAFFAWSFLYKMTVKVMGKADITSGEVVLHVGKKDLKKLKEGQKVYIEDKEGEILSFLDNEPVVSHFDLDDGEYTYKIIIGEMKPIDFLLK